MSNRIIDLPIGYSRRELRHAGKFGAATATDRFSWYQGHFFHRRDIDEEISKPVRLQWPESTLLIKSEQWEKDVHQQWPQADWVTSPRAILDRITDPSAGDDARHEAILVAETVEFDDTLRRRLIRALEEFNSASRFSQEDDTITVVCSAIRKYAMNMETSDFESYAQWFKPSETETLHHDIELELTQGVRWRLVYPPVEPPGEFPLLKAALGTLATDYLRPRLARQKNYAAILLEAILGVVVLEGIEGESRDAAELLRKISGLEISWLTDLVHAELRDAIDAIRLHATDLADAVATIVERARNGSS